MITESDKHYWHRYTATYQTVFDQAKASGRIARIVEWGVFQGGSIAWLHREFPEAEIHGLDIVAEKPMWPKAPQIKYHRVDQGDPEAVRKFYASIGAPDLIIEDGSHVPKHQSDCLRIGFRQLRSGGLYILEDIHTAYCEIIAQTRLLRHRVLIRLGLRWPGTVQLNSLALLLALDHLRDCGGDVKLALPALTRDSHFSADDVSFLADSIATSSLFHRNQLPLKCWRCGSSDFEYHTLKCRCGADVFGVADSMSYILTKR